MTDASLFFEFCGICDGGNEAQWCFQFITMAIASALQTNIAFVSVCGSGLCRRTAWMGSLHLHLLLAFLGLPDRRKVEFIKKKKSGNQPQPSAELEFKWYPLSQGLCLFDSYSAWQS